MRSGKGRELSHPCSLTGSGLGTVGSLMPWAHRSPSLPCLQTAALLCLCCALKALHQALNDNPEREAPYPGSLGLCCEPAASHQNQHTLQTWLSVNQQNGSARSSSPSSCLPLPLIFLSHSATSSALGLWQCTPRKGRMQSVILFTSRRLQGIAPHCWLRGDSAGQPSLSLDV